MTSGTDGAADGWTKTVLDGLSEDGPAKGGAPDDGEVVEAELVDDPTPDDGEIVDAELVDEADSAGVGEAAEDDGAPDDDDDDDVVDVEEVTDDESHDDPPAEPPPSTDISVEALVIDLERVTEERDQYLDASRRLQAEFENYKKQISKRETESRQRANESLVGELLPVLDAFDGAVANGAEDVIPMRTSLLDALVKQGLERIDPGDAPFDPALHEAVMHDDADDVDGPVVAEVMRAGYAWKGRVLRPAMVRTRG